MNVLIIFMKAPVAGRVKTRLTPAVSVDQAASLYRAFAKDTVKAARASGAAAVSVAYELHPDVPDLRWIEDAPSWFPQGRGHLGKRLAAAFNTGFRANATKVAIIASDCPEIEPELLRDAFARMDEAPAVLGPARDGGYYLIGLTSPMPRLFEGIEWSGPDVLAATTARLRACGKRFALLPERADIDTPADLQALAERLSKYTAGAEHTRQAIRSLSKRARAGGCNNAAASLTYLRDQT